MRTGTRAVLLLCGAFLLVSTAASTAHAQCLACSSSTSCAGSSERGGCNIQCQGTACACSDDLCTPKLRPSTFAPIPTTYAGAGIRLAVADNAFVVVDCRGNFATMAYTAAKADELERALDRVGLNPGVRGPDVAASGPAARERRSDE
jgi:hypothetical protein